MDIGFKSAFLISAIIHAGVAAPFYNHALLKNDFFKKDSVIVDYVILSQISNITAANTADRETAVTAGAERIDIKKASTQGNSAVKHDKEYYRKKSEAAGLKEKKNPAVNNTAERMAVEADKKDAKIQYNKDYIKYYGFLKDRIKARLQENYRFYKGEGDVCLSFVLNAKGALLTYNIDRSRSSKDDVLLHITRASLIAVAPFPPLPKAISAGQMSFNITISFKKQ